MHLHQTFIDSVFGGDVARCEAALEDGLSEMVHWSDIATCATTLPELEAPILALIEHRLGWLPHEQNRLRYEPYLRGLLQHYRSGALTPEAFATQVDEQIQLIRNEEMRHNTAPTYDGRLYRSYETFLPQQREAIRRRITRLLGYEPDLQHSVVAELWLREVMAEDIHLPDEPTAVDWKAMSLIRYREILVTEGKRAANASSLLPVAAANAAPL